MCQLLGMNCNTPTDICFSFTGFQKRGGGTDVHADGWGIAFFEYLIQVPANRMGFELAPVCLCQTGTILVLLAAFVLLIRSFSVRPRWELSELGSV